MHKKHKYDIIIIASVFAGGISLYLAVAHFLGAQVPCDITGGCETVLSSRYSSVFGLPLSVWGVAYFFGSVFLSLLCNHYLSVRKYLSIYLGLGAAGACVFLGLQFLVIREICQYCLAVDLLGIFIFIWDLNIEKLA